MKNLVINNALKIFKFNVEGYEPDAWFMYRNAIIFRAYPAGSTDEQKKKAVSPFFMVDPITKKCGNVSPAFDLDNFIKAAEKMKPL